MEEKTPRATPRPGLCGEEAADVTLFDPNRSENVNKTQSNTSSAFGTLNVFQSDLTRVGDFKRTISTGTFATMRVVPPVTLGCCGANYIGVKQKRE
ncbi:hypothetical protein FQN60_017889 [Etheostoma spectabile]|uniref:Uncharacterized protein n=1 Tax=Etheostoma spectabile TaxID=54343 RepID=A0A5J5DGD8_9PERO|nr:hypothetical protein FQN60_017889 [Etheostoma spectabile]